MLKKAHITTHLVTTTENGEDIIRTENDGACLIEETAVMLRYAEADNDGTAHLLLSNDLADLKRHGSTRSRMTFIEGRLLPCPYETQHGPLDLSLFTHSHSFSLDAQGGTFTARYTLLAAGKQVADNVLTVEWVFA